MMRPADRNRLERNSHQISSKSVGCGASYGVSTVKNVQKRIPVRMRDIFWGGVQPISVRGGVQPIIIITITTSRSRWHGGVGKLSFQPYCDGRSGTGEKETHFINVVGTKCNATKKTMRRNTSKTNQKRCHRSLGPLKKHAA